MERLEAHTQSQFLFEENYLFCSGFFHKSVFQKKADSRIGLRADAVGDSFRAGISNDFAASRKRSGALDDDD